MTFVRCIALVATAMMSGFALAGSAGADEDDITHYNRDAMARHDAAMYQLVDDLSECAGYHSMLMNRSESEWAKTGQADEHRKIFLTLGADALATLTTGSRNMRLLEMEARIISSQRSLQNRFGSLGGTADKQLKTLAQTCDRLRNSRRRVFGWTRVNHER